MPCSGGCVQQLTTRSYAAHQFGTGKKKTNRSMTSNVAGDVIEKECIACGAPRPHMLLPLVLPVKDSEYAAHLIASCRVCGLHSAYPMPTDNDLRRAYAQVPHTANVKADTFLGKQWRNYRDRGRMNVLRSVAPAGTVVDVGTGEGMFMRAARAAGGGWNLIGTDYSEVNVQLLQADGFDARLGTLDGVGIEPGSVDVVWASHVIEHMIDPVSFTETVWRYLKPGGALVVFIPSQTTLRARLGTSSWHQVNPPGHLWGFRPETFRPVVERSGFRVETLRNSLLICEMLCVARKDAG